jgi:hypothetical protein
LADRVNRFHIFADRRLPGHLVRIKGAASSNTHKVECRGSNQGIAQGNPAAQQNIGDHQTFFRAVTMADSFISRDEAG